MNSNTNTTALNVFSRRSVVAMGFAALAGAAVLAAGLPVNAQAAERTVKIGTEGLYAPFSFRTAAGELTGFDVEVAREAAKRAGVKLEFVAAPWDALIAALDAKRVDAVFNQVVVNDARKAKYALSSPYLEERGVVVVKEGTANPPASFENLKGRKVAGVPSANWVVAAANAGAQILPVKEGAQAFSLVATGRAEAAVNAESAFEAYKKAQPRAKLVVAKSVDAERVAGLFRKDDAALAEAFGKAIDSMKADGTIAKYAEQFLQPKE